VGRFLIVRCMTAENGYGPLSLQARGSQAQGQRNGVDNRKNGEAAKEEKSRAGGAERSEKMLQKNK